MNSNGITVQNNVTAYFSDDYIDLNLVIIERDSSVCFTINKSLV